MKTSKLKLLYKKRFWAGILLAQFLLFFLLSKVDFAVVLFQRFFEFQKQFHQLLFSKIPFSVGDFFYIILIVIFLFFFIKILNKKSRNNNALQLLVLLNILYFTYQVFWGILYFQKPIFDGLPKKEITSTELKTLTKIYLEKCKKTRVQVQEDKNGVFKVTNCQQIKEEILTRQKFIPSFINVKTSTKVLSFKPSIFQFVISYTGILGYYNPFTAEAQYNNALPSSYLPFTLAHESAHQLGYAREQEANFIGFLIGQNSSNTDLKYSTEYFVLKSLLRALVEKDLEFVESILSQYTPEMQRDRLAEKLFVQQHEGFLDVVFGFTNDLFLKSNQQDGSITYSYFIDLLMHYQQVDNDSK